MSHHRSVEEVAAAIEDMSQKEREVLLMRMAKMDDVLEDLEDIADLLRSARESSRPYDEFLADIRASGLDV